MYKKYIFNADEFNKKLESTSIDDYVKKGFSTSFDTSKENPLELPKSNFLDKYLDEDFFSKVFSRSIKENIEKNEINPFQKDFKLPYDAVSYHKSLTVLNACGCKVLDKKDLEDIEEIFSALDCLVEDETTEQVILKLKKIIGK